MCVCKGPESVRTSVRKVVGSAVPGRFTLGSSAGDSTKGVQWPRATVCKQKNVQRSTLLVWHSTANDLFCQQPPL